MEKQIVKKPPSKNHYVNNKDLYQAMKKYKEAVRKSEAEGTTKPRVPDYVGVCLMQICNRLSHRPNFINYSYREDMIADGIENCIAAVDNFDPDRYENPFAFFTMIAWNAFIRRIDKEKKQAYIKHKNYENSGIMDELWDQNYMEGGSTYAMQAKHNEYSEDLIRNFENKLTKNTKKSKIGVEKFAEEKEDEEPAPSAS
jgi:DNA-directed RNA polymerase specialized sigma24 family protein